LENLKAKSYIPDVVPEAEKAIMATIPECGIWHHEIFKRLTFFDDNLAITSLAKSAFTSARLSSPSSGVHAENSDTYRAPSASRSSKRKKRVNTG
jgi:hypothetical protein